LPEKSNLRESFDALEDEKRRKHSGKPKRGSLVPKCCDRKLQFNQLKDFLFDNTQYSLQLPQICIVHGRGDEQHKSLVER
jgi:hypothetical protein